MYISETTSKLSAALIWCGVHQLSWENLKKSHVYFSQKSFADLVLTCCWQIWNGIILDLWAFHPILVTLFLVAFGDEVIKILHDSLFLFHFILPWQWKTLYRKSRNLSDEKPKTKLPKYVMSRAKFMILWEGNKICKIHIFVSFKVHALTLT